MLIVGEMITLLLMAIALGMDAFSVGLAVGMQDIRLKRILWIGMVVGFFHMLMPFIGLSLGSLLSGKIENIAGLAAGSLLCAIGIQMIIQSFIKKETSIINPVGIGLLVFAFSVSLDSFSIGISLGLSGVATILAIFMFGAVSTFLTWIALLIGRRAHHLLGKYSEIFGGLVLIYFGINHFL